MQGNLEEILAPDGRRLFGYRWRPATAVRGRVILLHGIESHPQWFEGTCRWLAKLGFDVAALLRRGSGSDTQDRGDIGRYETWLQDVGQWVGRLAQETPQTPLHLMGISWGGKLACAYAAKFQAPIASLILVSPGLFPRVDVGFLIKMRVAWNYLFCPAKRFDLPIGGPAMFTASERWKRFIGEDPMRLKQVTARFLVQNAKLDRFLKKNQSRVQMPVLVLLAQTDEIIDTEKTKLCVSRLGCPRKKILEYPGMVHTLEFQDNPDIWRKDILCWLDGF